MWQQITTLHKVLQKEETTYEEMEESVSTVKQRKVKSDSTSPSNGRKESKSKRKKELEEEVVKPSSKLSTALRVIGLLSLIPLVLSIPWLLSHTSALIKNHEVSDIKTLTAVKTLTNEQNQQYLTYLWVFYGILLLSIKFYFKKDLHTWNSFFTQNISYMILTLGAYTMADLPKYFPIEIRHLALYLWCSFTMIFNIIFLFVDDTNYIEKEAKENRKEEKRRKKEEEEKKRKEEKLKKKIESMMSPTTKKIVDSVLYIFYVLIAVGIGWYGYNWYLDFAERLAIKHMSGGIDSPDYESFQT